MLEKTPDQKLPDVNVVELRVDNLPDSINTSKETVTHGELQQLPNNDVQNLSNNDVQNLSNNDVQNLSNNDVQNLSNKDIESSNDGVGRISNGNNRDSRLSFRLRKPNDNDQKTGNNGDTNAHISENNRSIDNQANSGRSNFAVRFFNRFSRRKSVSQFNVNSETTNRESGNRDGVAVIRFEKIDPNLDVNNNTGEDVEDKYAGKVVHEQQDNGNMGGTGVKKKMDSDDDTRPINPRDPRGEDPDIPEVETRTPKLINWWTWIAYSQGHVFNDLCASMWFTYLMPYLQKCVRLTPSNAGLLMLIGQIADALATPVIGLYSDRGSSAWYCGLGRRKTWHILGTLFVTLSFPFIFSPVVPLFQFSSDASYVLYYTPFICVFQFGWAAAQIAHLSLVPDLTPNDNERTSLLSVRYAFTVISNLLVYVIMYIAIGHASSSGERGLGPSDSSKFQYISYIVVGLGYISTFIFYFGVSEIKNRLLQLDLRQTSSSQMYETRKRTIGQLLRMPTLYTVAVLYMTARMFFNILQMFIVFYVEDTLALSKVNIALVPLVILISGFITSLGVKQINVKLGRKWSHLIGLGLGIIVSVIVLLNITGELIKIYMVYLVAVLYGMSSTVIQVTSFGMAADFVGDDVSNGAFIYGLLSFADKTSNGVVGYVIQHFNPEKDYYYRLALSYGCGIPCLVGILALIFLTPLPQVKLKSRGQPESDRIPVNIGDSSEDDLDNTTIGPVHS